MTTTKTETIVRGGRWWVWLLLWTVCAAAAEPPVDHLDAGTRAYASGDYAAAARAWRKLAQEGDADAQFALGTLYQTGRGVAQSDRQATEWFRRAAEQGSVPAQYNLGNAYKHGRGVEIDDAQAAHWWSRAAEAGLAPAQFNLGTAYLYGRGVARSVEKGLHWYRAAADQGHPGARAALGQVAQLQQQITAPSAQAWVQAQQPNHYTVQLLAADSEAQARKFIATLPSGTYAVCAYRSRGRRWVAVLAGHYDSLQSAQQAAQRWQAHAKPWIRRFADLQADLTD